MRHLEIKALLYFMAVVEQGSFTRAAKQRGVTQPALSFHISELEDELGMALLERTREGARATVYGQMLYDESLPIVRNLVGAVEQIATDGDTTAVGVVRLGLPPALCQHLLPPILDDFYRQYPQTLLEVREGFSSALSSDVEAGVLDFAVGGWTPANAGLRLEFAYEEDLHLVSGGEVAGLPGTACRLDEIPDLHLARVAQSNPLGALIASHIARGDIRPARTMVLDGIASAGAVLKSHWASIIPTSALRAIGPQNIAFVHPIEFPRISYQVYGISNSKVPLRPAAQLFKDKLVEGLAAAGMGRLSVRGQ